MDSEYTRNKKNVTKIQKVTATEEDSFCSALKIWENVPVVYLKIVTRAFKILIVKSFLNVNIFPY
jgi:hypothetical protein